MGHLNQQQLAQLLEAEQWDEAGNLITRYLDQLSLTKEDKSKAYLQFAATYLGVMNALNDAYERNLEEALSGLKALEKKEKEINEKIDLARVRGDIKKMSN